MIDPEAKARIMGIIKEYREFYERSGYLPHKAALRLIEIAEELLK